MEDIHSYPGNRLFGCTQELGAEHIQVGEDIRGCPCIRHASNDNAGGLDGGDDRGRRVALSLRCWRGVHIPIDYKYRVVERNGGELRASQFLCCLAGKQSGRKFDESFASEVDILVVVQNYWNGWVRVM